MSYDSTDDVVEHQLNVSKFIGQVIDELKQRAENHDDSKLSSEEKPLFDKYTPMLKDLDYGSEEYQKCLDQLGPALKHHYENNSHHPENHQNGIMDMTLIDLIELLADWKAATLRHDSGDLEKSLKHNKDRFNIPDAICTILDNTAKELGMF
jgi:hypothetical protein